MASQPNTSPALPETLHHHQRRMEGRDPNERDRTATPLEGFFDLTFATCFGLAAEQYAQAMTNGEYAAAFLGFGFASFAICWAWINFSWFASAYDTDDWIFRLTTMVQIIGVLVLAIGLPRLFESLEHAQRPDNAVMVLGYVIMRVAMIVQWLRAARQDPARRRSCIAYAIAISVAQAGWALQLALHTALVPTILITAILMVVEFVGPYVAEHLDGGTPWHAHHMAERNSLFALVAMGEGVVGAIAALSAVIAANGWTLYAVFVCIAGVGLIFGVWWVYYLVPSAAFLHAHRERAFGWGYGQIVVVTSIVATGAGLRIAAHFIDHTSHMSELGALLAVATPVWVFLLSTYLLYSYLVRQADPLHKWLVLVTAGVVGVAVAASIAGVAMPICLLILMLAPAVTVVGYEVAGYRHQARALTNLESE